jgi:hypothetical protein
MRAKALRRLIKVKVLKNSKEILYQLTPKYLAKCRFLGIKLMESHLQSKNLYLSLVNHQLTTAP